MTAKRLINYEQDMCRKIFAFALLTAMFAGCHVLIGITDTTSSAELTVTIDGDGAGSIYSMPPGIECGETCVATFQVGTEVTLTPASALASSFTGWSGDGECMGRGPCTLVVDSTYAVHAHFEQGGKVRAVAHFGGPDGDFVLEASTDNEGNRILGGNFRDVTNLGGPSLSSNGDTDVFIAKFDRDGNHIWSVSFGGIGRDELHGLQLDGDGNIFASGEYAGTLTIGSTTLPRGASIDTFVAKFAAATGEPMWAQGFVGQNVVRTHGIAVDGDNNVIVSFYFKGSSNFGKGDETASAGDDTVLAKYKGQDGGHIWSKTFGSIGETAADDQITNVVCDIHDNSIVITGYFVDTINLGGNNLVQTGDGRNMFLARYDTNGQHIWSRGHGTDEDVFPGSSCLDSDGDIIVSGRFSGRISLGGDDFISTDDDDIFLARYSRVNGAHRWSRVWSGAGYKGITGASLLSSGDIVVSGFYSLDTDFDGMLMSNATRTNLFAARVADVDGTLVWLTTFGDEQGAGGGRGRAISVDPYDDSVLLLGTFNDTVDFGIGDAFQSAGAEDIAIVELSP